MSRYVRGLEHPGIDRLRAQIGARLATFPDDVARHIEVDGEEHSPMAMPMVADLCGEDESRWACPATITTALEARVRLWDGIVPALDDQPLAG